MNYQCIK